MSLKAGIIGMPNVGKSTLFNAITKKHILAANYPFATIDPNVGLVTVPDERLVNLENMYMPERCIPVQYEFTDIAGLVKGASQGEGLGNKFLSEIREVDAVIHVVRCFDDDDIIHVDGNVDPVRDADIINLELAISDLELLQTRLDKIYKKAHTTNDKVLLKEVDLLTRLKDSLEKGTPLREVSMSDEEIKMIKAFNFITLKPMIYLANVSEEDVSKEHIKYVDDLKDHIGDYPIVKMCTKIESELIEFSDEDKIEFLKDVGISESGLDKLIRVTYEMLGLRTFFTVGKDEVKAWTFKDGMKAPQCAGIIHSDFERGFIKAEVMSYEDLISLGDEKKVKEAGKTRLEGKEYIMQDGDIVLFRFNV